MTHTSPTTFAVWSVLSTALGAFLLGHLYRFDKFKCLKWSNAPYSGAFKRIMTYTYLITIPLIMIYSFGFAYIKYNEGFLDVGGTIIPKPYTYWSANYRHAIFPLMMVFAFSWSFEMVTHLEELCFWYFLITAGPAQPDWFHSPYFYIWTSGSIAAFIYLPVVTIVYRTNPLSCEARMFTAGSLGDLILTLAFIPILWRFPGFIRKVKAEGVDSTIIVRLRKFYELNVIRIIFRFLMQIPLLMLGIDGVKPHNHELNESLFWTDLLSTIAALGCAFSSVCTLLIFFPRSYEAEYHAKEASHRRSIRSFTSRQSHEPQPAYSQYADDDSDRDVFEPADTLGKPVTFNNTAHKWSDGNHYMDDDNDDFDKYELQQQQTSERMMRPGLVRERFSSKLRERERRIAKSTKRLGAGLQDALSRRLMRLSMSTPTATTRPNRKRNEGEGANANANAFSFSLTMPSLTLGRERPDQDTATRRTTPSSRSVLPRKRSDSTAVVTISAEEEDIDGGGKTLERKGTYLLTDSPVLRAQRMQEQERRFREQSGRAAAAAAASVETLEAAYEAGAGAGARVVMEPVFDGTLSTSPVDAGDIGLGYGITPGYAHAAGTSDPLDEKKEEEEENAEVDVDSFALDLPPPPSSTVPSYSQATGIGAGMASFSQPVQPATAPTPSAIAQGQGQGHVHGPRPITKSGSISTTGTMGTRRALPTPPVADPLGAAPAYYQSESAPVPVQEQDYLDDERDRDRDQRRGGQAGAGIGPRNEPTTTPMRMGTASSAVAMSFKHPFASATPPLDRREPAPPLTILTRPPPLSPLHPSNNSNNNAGMWETTNDAALISIQPRFEGGGGAETGITITGMMARHPRHYRHRQPHIRTTNASAAPSSASAVEVEMGTTTGTGIGMPSSSGMGLTRANLARLNNSSASASRVSQLNPLVKTFTSPIDFLDRILEGEGSRSGSAAGGGGLV